MWPVISFDPHFDSPTHLYNFDATSLLLESSLDENKKLFLAEGSKKKLKILGLNPSTVVSREGTSFKKRGVSLISLDGNLSAIIIKIKDGSYLTDYLFKQSLYFFYINTQHMQLST
jgi:hypothetical protein